jgi:hypothetical protein
MAFYYGKYTGIVKDNQDPEKLGQLTVNVPAIFDNDETVVARPALPYGFFFVPENGAKVWVEFEGGDTGLPIWTGVQYVAGEWASEGAVSPPQKRVLKTAAGHVVVFDDKSGEEGIDVKDGVNNHEIKLDGSGIQVNDGKNNHTVKLDSSGIAITDGVNQNQVKLDSSGITIQAASGAQVQLTAAGVTVDAGAGLVTVKGSAVMLNNGVLPVIRVTDTGIGNLGAPVPIVGPGNPTVLA